MKSRIFNYLTICALVAMTAVGCDKDGDQVGGKTLSIESISPETGGPGDELVINGTGFPLDKSQIAVMVNDIAFAIEGCNEEQILAIVPENEAIGKAPVVVTVGGESCRSRESFTYHDSRVLVKSVTPLQGSTGTEVTIVGQNFPADGPVSVTINGVALAVVSADASKIVVTIPDNPEIGTGPIVVNTGEGSIESKDEFTFTDIIMSISAIAPESAGPGADVTITGENFPTDVAAKVTVNDVEFAVKSATATQIVATVPENEAIGKGKVKVVAGRKTAYSDKDFTYLEPVMSITSFTPASAGSGIDVTITGENFPADKTLVAVSVNDVAFTVKSVTKTQVVVTVPINDNIGVGKIKVTAKGKTAVSTSDFTHIVCTMKIASFTPAGGPFGSEITITGEDFPATAAEVKATVNGIELAVKSISATQIVVTVPKNKAVGSGKITLQDQYGSCESGSEFTYKLTRTVSVLAGTGAAGYTDGAGNEAQFNFYIGGAQIGGIAVDRDLNVYTTDRGNLRLRKVTPDGQVSTYGGNNTPDWGANWMWNANATPLDVYTQACDIVYDKINHRLFVADLGVSPGYMIDVAANKAFYAGWAAAITIAIDNLSGALYFSRAGALLAKTDGIYGGNAEAGAELNQKAGISGLAVAADGDVYVSVAAENKIYKYAKGQWSTPVVVAGTGNAGFKDGPALEAEFSAPGRICFDNAGNLLVAGNGSDGASADNADQSIRYIDLKTNTVTTFAGAGTSAAANESFVVDGYGGADNRSVTLPAVFMAPAAVAVDKNDAVYVLDRAGNTIKKIVTE